MPYVRDAWYVAAWSGELRDSPLGARILGEPIVVWRSDDGGVSAFEDRCVHRHAALSLGRCEGNHLRCMYHGLLFNREGRVVEIPGQDLIPEQARVRRYPVEERHSWIWVWMGRPEAADVALIPPAVGLEHPDYLLGSGTLDYCAEARLINNNLLDFSHLSFVHAGSFGSSETWARVQPKVTPFDRGVSFERWLLNEKAIPGMDSSGPVERYSRYDFFLPGILLMTGGSYPTGTFERLNGHAPELAEAIAGRSFTSQAVTPMTDKTSRYFFSWGPHRDHGDERTRDVMMEIAGKAFNEDRVMIEAQQRIVDIDPTVREMPTAADKGLILYNRLVDRMIRKDGQRSEEEPRAANSPS